MITREELYRLVWTVPVRQACQQLGVSNSYVARVCFAMDVPRPPRGYWAKKGAGRAPAPPPLPPARPGHPSCWTKGGAFGALGYYKDRTLWATAKTNDVHPLTVVARRIFGAAKPDEGGYLATRVCSAIDLRTTPASLERALCLADHLFRTLEQKGHPVREALDRFARPEIKEDETDLVRSAKGRRSAMPRWAPQFPTIVTIGEAEIGLTIIETTTPAQMQYVGNGCFVPVAEARRKHGTQIAGLTWTEWQRIPTGRFRLVGYSPDKSRPRQKSWGPSTSSEFAPDIAAAMSGLQTFYTTD